MPLALPFLSIGPKVIVEPMTLTAKSCWLIHILTLGSFSRTSIVDSFARVVMIDIRYLWLCHRRHRIRFDEIDLKSNLNIVLV